MVAASFFAVAIGTTTGGGFLAIRSPFARPAPTLNLLETCEISSLANLAHIPPLEVEGWAPTLSEVGLTRVPAYPGGDTLFRLLVVELRYSCLRPRMALPPL